MAVKYETRIYPTWPRAMTQSRSSGEPLNRFATWLDRLHLVRILAALSNVGILIAVIAFWFDFTDRYEARTNQAWALLTNPAPGNSGKVAALEYLNKEIKVLGLTLKKPQTLTGIDLSTRQSDVFTGKGRTSTRQDGAPVYLDSVQLPGVDFTAARLERANLDNANLSGARLIGTRLSGVSLNLANLSGAHFFETDLTGAKLIGVDMSNATLIEANLSDSHIIADPEWGSVKIERTNISGAEVFWPSYPNLAFPIPVGDSIAFWAWSDKLPVMGHGNVSDDGRWWFQKTEETTEESAVRLIPGLVICSASLRDERSEYRHLMPKACAPPGYFQLKPGP